MYLIVDIGNTCAKLAVFDGAEMLCVEQCSNRTLDALPSLAARYPFQRGILSSVIDLDESVRAAWEALPFPRLQLNSHTPLPITHRYATPETLGPDRIAAVVGAHDRFPNHDILVIDAGTAITYDFIDHHGCYHGGNIAPGMAMRFKALHAFTGRLPLVESSADVPLLGDTTASAIQSGVVRGIQWEMEGCIRQLQRIYPDLLVFLTGGTTFSFDTNVKSTIFADKFLVLKGLNRILRYNDSL